LIEADDLMLAIGIAFVMVLAFLIFRAWWKFGKRMHFYDYQERMTAASIRDIPNILKDEMESKREEMDLNRENGVIDGKEKE
jgi:hypothetical protein